MFRSTTTDSIVIRRERMGEFHKSLTLLTSTLGLVTATAFGAYKMKSRLRMGSEPFTHARVSLYLNPVRHSYKITELEVRESFERLRGELVLFSAASFWAEVVMKSFGAGEISGTLFRLFLDCLKLLNGSGPEREPYFTSQFLWRFLSLCGYQPDIARCDGCGAHLDPAQESVYEQSANAFLCNACRLSPFLLLPAGVLRYLSATGTLPLENACQVSLDRESLGALKDFLFQAVRAVLEGEIRSSRFLADARAERFPVNARMHDGTDARPLRGSPGDAV
jgi:DNA repair protein RecO (recombination protein O)